MSIIPRNIDTLSTILSGNVGTKRTTILDLVKNATGEVDVNIVHQLFPDVEIPTIQTIYEEAKNDVQNGTADASQYSGTEKGKEKEREIYFLFVFSESSSSPYFSDDLIHAAYYSIFEQSSNFDVAWKAYSNYKNNSRNKDNADAILKMFSALYAYKTWEDFKKTNPSKMTNGYIELKNGHILKFESWVHVCDGHSVFTNGIETIVKQDGSRIDSFDYYGNDEDAINAIVTLDLLLNKNVFLPIINTPDIFILELKEPNSTEEPYKVYIKRIDNKVHIYVFQPVGNEMKLVTFYSKSYIHNTINMEEVLKQRLEEKGNYNTDINKNIVIAMTSSVAGGITIRGNNDFDKSNAEYRLITNFDVGISKIVAEIDLEDGIAFDDKLYEIVSSWSKSGVGNSFDDQFTKLSDQLEKIVELSNNLPSEIDRGAFIAFICSAFDKRDIIKLFNDEDSLDYTDENYEKAKRVAGRLLRARSRFISDMIGVNKNNKIPSFLGEDLYSDLLQKFFEDVDRGYSVDVALNQLKINIRQKINEEIYKRKIPYALSEISIFNTYNAAILPEIWDW